MIHGTCHRAFRPVALTLRSLLRWYPRGGAAVCVYHRGRPIVDLWGGSRGKRRLPWLEDTCSLSFSTTKGVTAAALHILADRGLVEYEAPLARYWPEFAQNGKSGITLRQVLCHEAGLHRLRGRIDRAERMLDWEHMVDVLARAESEGLGTGNGYHALTFGWLIGEVIQRVSGKPFAQFIREEIAEPLGLDGLRIGDPPGQERIAELVLQSSQLPNPSLLSGIAGVTGAVLRTIRSPFDPASLAGALLVDGIHTFPWTDLGALRAPIPSANGLFTARSLACMYAALIGEVNGVRLISAETLKTVTRVQNRGLDRVALIPLQWRLGYHRAFTTRGSPRGAFGHYGLGGSGAWADPKRQLTMALVVNSGIGTPFGDIRTALMGGTVLKCAKSLSLTREAQEVEPVSNLIPL